MGFAANHDDTLVAVGVRRAASHRAGRCSAVHSRWAANDRPEYLAILDGGVACAAALAFFAPNHELKCTYNYGG